MRFLASQVASVCGGNLHGDDVDFDGVFIDTRSVQPWRLFVPLKGERDGHKYIPEAIAQGVAAYLTDGPRVKGATAISVNDTAVALRQIGAAARARLSQRVVAVTGSVGKTTTKDLLGSIASNAGNAAVSPLSYNNDTGVPIALANAADDVFTTVLELGARFPGDLTSLCDIARPTVGVVTNIGLAHMGTFKNIEGAASAKSELIQALPSNGTAVLNAGDPLVYAMSSLTSARVLTFGLDSGDVRASKISLDDELRPSFRLHSPNGTVNVKLGLSGAHNILNALGATAGALALRVSMHDVVDGLQNAVAAPHRMRMLKGASGFTLIDDTYNANPTSMNAALQALGALPTRGRKVAVLGPMAELGDVSDRQHSEVGDLARLLDIEVVGVGTPAYGGTLVEDIDKVRGTIGTLTQRDAVLVKASRVSGLEHLVASLAVA